MTENGADTAGGRLVTKRFIPAREKNDIYAEDHIFKACAYCRVSTDSEMQQTSFELQCEHYSNLAGDHPNWDLRHVYADEGISGTSLKHREQFNEMLSACERGEFDLIITKSVSRFARNLVDCVSLIRKLKGQNPPVGVYFEQENLYTLSGESELLLSVIATLAQEESINKSDSMVWSLQQRFKSGKLLMPELYGYSRERDVTGRYIRDAKLQIVESEAKVIRFIFDSFLLGYPLKGICEILNELGIPTKTGLDKWNDGTIRYILSNERYCGDVLTWKTFTADVFEHRKKKNRADRDQYLYENDHDAIISISKFEAAQTLLANKKHRVGRFPVMHVINDGIFKGFVPVNHHWINDDPSSYYEASNTASDYDRGHQRIRKSEFSAFSLDGYQVVRGEFSSGRPECPCLTVSSGKICFNKICLRKFAESEYIQLLVHPAERKLAIRPCQQNDVYSIRWNLPDREINSKTLSCKYFSKALFQMMNWNMDYQYQIRGTWASQGSYQIIIFDITKALSAMQMVIDEDETVEVKRKRGRKVYLCPSEWDFSFGEEFYDFNFHNSFYCISSQPNWKADTSSLPVQDSSLPELPTEEELRNSIQALRERSNKE